MSFVYSSIPTVHLGFLSPPILIPILPTNTSISTHTHIFAFTFTNLHLHTQRKRQRERGRKRAQFFFRIQLFYIPLINTIYQIHSLANFATTSICNYSHLFIFLKKKPQNIHFSGWPRQIFKCERRSK